MAGAQNPDEMDVSAFLDQAEEYESSGDVRDSLIKILQISGQSHPLAALRAAELQKWAAGPGYADILAGNYPRRSRGQERPDERGRPGCGRLLPGQLHHLRRSLFKVVGRVGSVAGTVGGAAANRMRDWWRGPDEPPAP